MSSARGADTKGTKDDERAKSAICGNSACYTLALHRHPTMNRLLPLLAVLVLTPVAALADPITSLVVIGDSVSDMGNAFAITGVFPPAPYAQRASNGPVAAEVLAAQLGVPLAPSVAGGTNYAVVGAATGPVAAAGGVDNLAVVLYGQLALNGTGLINQAAAYLSTGPVIDAAGTLFLVWGGPNDFFLDNTPAGAANAVNNLGLIIDALYTAGARRFLVPGLTDLSLTPFGLGLPPLERAGLQALSVGFNAGLDTVLDTLELIRPDIDITRFDTFAFLTAINANPAAFGFANAVDQCLTGDFVAGTFVCGDPDSYVFWDSVHPTAAAHEALGKAFANAVPEPSFLTLLGLGSIVVARRLRRR